MEFLKNDVLILDGAMGTQLIEAGVDPGKSANYLNIESPDDIIRVHSDYLEAGCDAERGRSLRKLQKTGKSPRKRRSRCLHR